MKKRADKGVVQTTFINKKPSFYPSFFSYCLGLLFLLLSFLGTAEANAQATGTNTATSSNVEILYKGFVRNNNNTVTLTFSVKNNTTKALGFVAFELPSGAKATNPSNSTKSFHYQVENPTKNPFYSIKFQATNAEGFRNGVEDIFSYTLTSSQFDKLSTIRAVANTINSSSKVFFNSQTTTSSTNCNKPTVTISGPESLCNLADEPYTYSAGEAEAGTTYTYTLPEGLYLMDGEGTSSISVVPMMEEDQLNQPQTISVTATNLCGSTSAQMNVVVKDCNSAQVLPVELIQFSSIATNNKVNLSWSTASEQNNDRFEVERSTNGIDFEKIGQVQGNGNSTIVRQYNYTDDQPSTGTFYYRLKQVDFDGGSEYSKIIAVDVKASAAGKGLLVDNTYPNPFQGNININFTLAINESAKITFYNLSGQVVAAKEVKGLAGANQVEFTGLDKLSQGMYILKVTSGNQSVSQRLVKAN